MKVLVTGANGLLGVNLVRELLRSNIEVKAFVRHSANLKGLHDVPCQLIRGDISSFDDVQKALKDCDAVIHAASTTSVLPLGYEFYEKINVDTTKNVVQAVLSQGNKRMIHVSTAQAFGPGPKKNPGTESSPFTLAHYNSGYINSKYNAQLHVLKSVERQNLNAVIINPAFMIGPYDIKPSSGRIILQGLKRGLQWCPNGGKNFVDVRDVAQGIQIALNTGAAGECYLITGENLTYREFFSELNNIAHRKRIQIVPPKIILHTIGTAVETWNNLTGQKHAFNKSNAHLINLENYYSGEKARLEFNLKPTPTKVAIQDAVEWFKKENYISDDNYSTHGTSFDL